VLHFVASGSTCIFQNPVAGFMVNLSDKHPLGQPSRIATLLSSDIKQRLINSLALRAKHDRDYESSAIPRETGSPIGRCTSSGSERGPSEGKLQSYKLSHHEHY
jgi:hypothetical protein